MILAFMFLSGFAFGISLMMFRVNIEIFRRVSWHPFAALIIGVASFIAAFVW